MNTETLILTTFLTIVGCQNHTQLETAPLKSSHQSENTAFPLVGKWYYSKMFYGSELTLKQDGSFQYRYSGCLGPRYSEGTWQLNGQKVILTSYPSFQDKSISTAVTLEESSPVEQVEASSLKEKKSKRTKQPLQLYKFKLDEQNPLFLTSKVTADTTEFFEQQVLIVKNDSLYWMDVQEKEQHVYGKEKRMNNNR